MSGTVRLHRVLRAKPERLYKAFIDAEAMANGTVNYNTGTGQRGRGAGAGRGGGEGRGGQGRGVGPNGTNPPD
jgi:uncharacterized protein YndB with AHSA1/START domain